MFIIDIYERVLKLVVYIGSKAKLANEILPIILKNREVDQWYVEPFAGGFNLIDKVSGNRIANDINYYVIELFKAIQNDWIPPDSITKELYYDIKKQPEKYPPYLVGFVGIVCSYCGKWRGGYRNSIFKSGFRNYCDEGRRNLIKQASGIKGVLIENKSYLDLHIPKNSIIYCDPPYQDTTKYQGINFNHSEFWDWARKKSLEGHKVYVSEYSAPDDFEEVWSKGVSCTLRSKETSKKAIEKIFIFKK